MQPIKSNDLKETTSIILAEEATKILIEKKGVNIKLFSLNGENPITDYYINVTGRSSTHVASLADELVYLIGLRGRDALRIEGKRGANWILVDFGDVIVNVFDKEAREFYNFDRLLSADDEINIEDLVREVDEKMNAAKE